MPNDTSASDIITTAFVNGRPIVPFLGAGVSVGNGFPSMTAITTYLAKVQFYIRYVADWTPPAGSSDTTYLRHLGWPNVHQLNASIWRYLSPIDAEADQERESRFQRTTHRCVKTFKSHEPLLEELARKRWEIPSHRVHLATQLQFLENLSEQDWGAAASLCRPVVTGETSLRGDWYDLMMSLTEGDFDLVDSLFLSLGRGRTPAAAHVFLAQFADAFRVRLFLSLNFDAFLETALWDEGQAPNVIEVAKDSDLPSRDAIRDRLTVLKLHGGPYGLRIGERIYETADANTLQRASRIIPENALIVVIGFSGYERRITQVLYDHAIRGRKLDPNRTSLLWMNYGDEIDRPVAELIRKLDDKSDREPLVIKQYADAPLFLFDLLTRHRLAHPAGRERYRCLPTMPWAVAQNDSTPPEKTRPEHQDKRILAFYRKEDWNHDLPREEARGHSDASVAMAGFCRQLGKTHQTIWIDCEQHHTVDGIVVDILDSIRRYDPSFPPLLVQTPDEEQHGKPHDVPPAHSRAIERIREALQRGNYVLCIDSPETIGRPQTVHHGTPSLTLPQQAEADPEGTRSSTQKELIQGFKDRVQGFFAFLTALLGNKNAYDIGESLIGVAFAPASPRHVRRAKSGPPETLSYVDECVASLKRFVISNERTIESVPARKVYDLPPEILDDCALLRELVNLLNDGTESPFDLSAEIVPMVLSVFRRPRSYLGYLALLQVPSDPPLLNKYTGASPAFWDTLFKQPRDSQQTPPDYPCSYRDGQTYLGGGQLWIPRRLHNRAYNRLTDIGHRVADQLRNSPESRTRPEEVYSAILSLLATAILHRRAARYYFSEVYESTGDITAFREYIYHRVSYLRSLCRLLLVIGHWAKTPDPARDSELRERLGQALNNYRHADPERQVPEDPSWEKLRLEVREAWYQELKAFRATLSREYEAVRQHLYAGTWVSILERVRVFDLEEMYNADAFKTPGLSADAEGKLCEREIAALREEIERQKLDARFEMADWGSTIADQEVANRAIDELLVKDGKNAHPLVLDVYTVNYPVKDPPALELVYSALPKRPVPPLTPADFVKWFVKLIECAEGHSRLARVYHERAAPQADGTGPEADTGKRKTNQERALAIEKRLGQWLELVEQLAANDDVIPPFSAEIQRFLRERWTVLMLDLAVDHARFQFDKYNPWLSKRPQPRREGTAPPSVTDARKYAIVLFEKTRRTVFQDVRTYNLYRAKSLRMVARSEILSATKKEDFQKPIADLNLALRLLHRSRSADPLEAVACYRTKAEALMLWAHMLVWTTNIAETRSASRARLDAARSMIGRALNAFTQRQRNVSWWLRLCRDKAQWSVLSCILRVCEARAGLEQSGRRPEGQHAGESVLVRSRRQEFEADLQYGLEAIRAGLDALLPVGGEAVSSPASIQWKGFARQWLNLARGTEHFDSERNGLFEKHWSSANQAARMPKLYECWVEALKTHALDQIDTDTPNYPALFKDIAPEREQADFTHLVNQLFGTFVARSPNIRGC